MSLRLDVVDRLNLAVMEAFLALPRRGLEIGGLLLGSIRSRGDAASVEIEDFEPVECDHAVGPSYLLSADDRAALDRRVRRGPPGAPSIVGFYRSHTRDEFAATPEDLELMSEFFPGPADVLLLIRPHRDRPAEAGFVIWEGREIRSAKPYLDFPFRRGALETGRYELVTQAARAVVAPVSSLAPVQPVKHELVLQPMLPAPLIEPLRTKSASRIRREEWLVASALVLLAILSRVHGNVAAPKPAPGAAAISTPAKPAPAAAAAFEASPASSAPQRSEPRAQAAGGSIPKPSPFDKSDLSADKSDPRADKSDLAADKSGRTAPKHRAMAPLPPVPVSEAARLAAAPPLASVDLSAPPPPVRAEVISVSPNIPPVEHPSVPAAHPLVTVAIDPVSPPVPRSGVFHRLGFGGKARPLPDFTPPKALRQPSPELPPALIRDIREQVPIDVRVYIDRAGKVRYSELLSKGTGPARDLASLAVFTSRHWEFSPARREGEPVESEVILHFRFGPESR